MQEEARCEQQPNGAWRVWLHPAGREVVVYSDESEALDVTELINLKIKLDAKLPTDGLTNDLDAQQIELVANMPMEELLQRVLPEQVESESDDKGNRAHKSDNQQNADAKKEDKKGSQEIEERLPRGQPFSRWIENGDGSVSRTLSASYGQAPDKTYALNIIPGIQNKLGIKGRDFTIIIKSTDPQLDGKQFQVGFSRLEGKVARVTVTRGIRDVARCLNLQPKEVITLSKGPKRDAVYIRVDRDRQSSRNRAATESVKQMVNNGGGVQKRQLPSPSNDVQAPPPLAKRSKSSTDPSSTPGVGQKELKQSTVAPGLVQVEQGAAERRSLPEMLALVKSIIEKEAVGLSAAERISYRTKFMIKMTPEVRVSSLQMLEELDGAGEHDGVKLCVQMSLRDLN